MPYRVSRTGQPLTERASLVLSNSTFGDQWSLVYNNESLRALDLTPFRIETNQFKIEVTIMGENYRGEAKTFHVVSDGAGGGLKIKQ